MSAAHGAPALMLVGVCRPKVMVSDLAAAVLSERELRVAIRHELGHRSSRDNLKKLLINATPFPGMSSLERAWREAAELAADDAAVESQQDALDLASALIKAFPLVATMGRARAGERTGVCLLGHQPAGAAAAGMAHSSAPSQVVGVGAGLGPHRYCHREQLRHNARTDPPADGVPCPVEHLFPDKPDSNSPQAEGAS